MAPTTYGEVLARNTRAARSRIGLSQQRLAARMRALGYDAWLHQTVGNVENGKRRVTAEEILGLAESLETSVAALARPTDDDKLVEFPSGQSVTVEHVQRLVAPGRNDGEVKWSGDEPVFPGPPMTYADAESRLAALDSDARAQYEAVKAALISGERPEVQPVVAAIVTSRRGILVTERRDGKPPWGFVSGEVRKDPAESPQDAAERETKEETGLEVRSGEVIGERDHPATGRRMIYIAAKPVRGTAAIVADQRELKNVDWVSLAKAEQLMPDMFGPVHDYLEAELGRKS